MVLFNQQLGALRKLLQIPRPRISIGLKIPRSRMSIEIPKNSVIARLAPFCASEKIYLKVNQMSWFE